MSGPDVYLRSWQVFEFKVTNLSTPSELSPNAHSNLRERKANAEGSERKGPTASPEARLFRYHSQFHSTLTTSQYQLYVSRIDPPRQLVSRGELHPCSPSYFVRVDSARSPHVGHLRTFSKRQCTMAVRLQCSTQHKRQRSRPSSQRFDVQRSGGRGRAR